MPAPPTQAVLGPRLPRPFGAVHWRGALTLARRELWRFLKEWPETVIAPAFSTVLYIVVFVLALGPDRDHPDGAGVVAFILPGLVMFAVLLRSVETTAFSLSFDRIEGILPDVLMPPLAPSELTFAYAAAGAVSGLITGLPCLLAVWVIFDLPTAQPVLALGFAGLGALMMAMVGIIVGLWAHKWDRVEAAFAFMLVPLLFLSGTFVPAEALPTPLDWIAQANPMFYVIDGFRGAMLGQSTAPAPLGLAVAAATCAVLAGVTGRLIGRGWRLKP